MTLAAGASAFRQLAPRLGSESGVAALYVFGAVARGEARADHSRVDLVTRAALRTPWEPRLEAEARDVA